MPARIPKNFVIGLVIFFAILLLIDRYYWSQISQWREDQSTNLWLGFTNGIRDLPVGLSSSRKIPNPNGMPLLGSFLSMLPNLLAVSFFLGAAQIVLITLVGWKASDNHWRYFLFAALPSLSSVALRSTSVEFWNQYMMTLLNLCFIFWGVLYLQNASPWSLPPIAFLVLLAPSLYLGGIVNAIVMALLTLGMIIYKRPNANPLPAIGLIALLLLLSMLLVWRPYFRNVGPGQIMQSMQLKADPVSAVPPAFAQADLRILSWPAQVLLSIASKAYVAQVLFTLTTFLSALFYTWIHRVSLRNLKLNGNPSLRALIILSGSFMLLAYSISNWLGGADWLHNRRPDQTVQFLPMLLFFVFLLPLLIPWKAGLGRIMRGLSEILLGGFVIANLLCGWMIIGDHLQYRGSILTEADVPLIYKMQAVDFIAQDWKHHSSSNVVPVDYDLGGGRWDWVPKFGRKLTQWYPAPLTIGRSFDYDLLRRYGLTNRQEGKQLRTFGTGRYLVTYAFENPPTIEKGQVTHYLFGRLRVSVIEESK